MQHTHRMRLIGVGMENVLNSFSVVKSMLSGTGITA